MELRRRSFNLAERELPRFEYDKSLKPAPEKLSSKTGQFKLELLRGLCSVGISGMYPGEAIWPKEI